MKRKLFIQIFSNFLIIFVLVFLSCFMFFDRSITVSNSEESGLYYRGSSASNGVSLMVNVYDGNEHLEKMLEIFDKYDIKTTFFVGGVWVSKNPELLEKIVNSGHEIGNHGFFHKDHKKLNYQDNQIEILNNHKIVKSITGLNMNLFAPPSGAFSQITLNAAKNLGYDTIMWSKDTIDWRDHDKNLIFKRATTKISSGELILMHPTNETAEALEDIICEILGKNLKIIPVSQNIYANIV